MLIKCPECELQVSNKAAFCPHCGYLFKPAVTVKPRTKNKRRRLPNGFGQISEIKNRNLRNPYRAMVTVGKTEEGRPICKPLKPNAYFPTYNDAYMALVEYNKNPYELDSQITMNELYSKWTEKNFPSKSVGTRRSIELAWKYCSTIYDVPVVTVRIRHLRGCIETGKYNIHGIDHLPTPAIQKRMKNTFNQLFDYAVEYELTDRNYAREFTLDTEVARAAEEVQNEHKPYTNDEIAKIWKFKEETIARAILIQCYSGWRPQELVLLKLENINLEENTFQGGMKTAAGKNRVVPIHPKIKELVLTQIDIARQYGCEYLFCDSSGAPYTYHTFRYAFIQLCKQLNLDTNHRPHDGRKHFVTMAKKYNVDEYAIKYIIGHKISDLTESTYTEREISWLMNEIKKIQ